MIVAVFVACISDKALCRALNKRVKVKLADIIALIIRSKSCYLGTDRRGNLFGGVCLRFLGNLAFSACSNRDIRFRRGGGYIRRIGNAESVPRHDSIACNICFHKRTAENNGQLKCYDACEYYKNRSKPYRYSFGHNLIPFINLFRLYYPSVQKWVCVLTVYTHLKMQMRAGGIAR